ncbi:hypothetical protein Tco_1301883 [Tanacetum coccineum]
MFLTNLQPKWRCFTVDLNKLDINNLFDLLKNNQEEVNEIREEIKKKDTIVNDPLALIATSNQLRNTYRSQASKITNIVSYNPPYDSEDANPT